MKLLLIDGHNLLFQMFFGMPSRIYNKDGVLINGTLGFVGGLNKIIKMTNPTHVLVIFDGECHNKRKDLLSTYKGNRPDYYLSEENPFSQLDDIKKCLSYMNVSFTECLDCEADDLIAQYVFTYENQMEIVISSFDSDFFQLVNKNVTILRYRGKNSYLINEDYIYDKFAITPKQYPLFKSITGDNSDNVKGVFNVGPKKASKIVFNCTNPQDLFNNLSNVVPEKLRLQIDSAKDLINLNFSLIKLTGTNSLPINLQDIQYNINTLSTTAILQKVGLK